MKILQITPEKNCINTQVPYDSRADYMGDLLFHGLRELFGSDVVDFPRKDHLYKGYEYGHKLWGRGFSYSSLLDELNTDRSYIQEKIKNDYFKLIILTSHNTVDHYPAIFYSYLDRIRDLNPTIKIAVVNGKDKPEIYDRVWKYTNYHFQREVPANLDGRLIPINFAIPSCKVLDKVPDKKQILASIVPANHDHINRSTHKYENEEDYYKEYQQSYFALTTCKAGWDCMRHYEILANGCVPLFGDIADCPDKTLTMLPKNLLKEIKNKFCTVSYFDKNTIDLNTNYVVDHIPKDNYREFAEDLLDYTRNYLTTEYLAKYVLEKCEC